MDAATRSRFEARARIMKALAHPTRLFLVEELSRGEQCVGDLTRLVGADVSTVSKHLAILRNVGLVDDVKQGAMVFYRLRVPCAVGFFDCVENVIAQNAKEQARLAG